MTYITDPAEWCDAHDVTVVDDDAHLYTFAFENYHVRAHPEGVPTQALTPASTVTFDNRVGVCVNPAEFYPTPGDARNSLQYPGWVRVLLVATPVAGLVPSRPSGPLWRYGAMVHTLRYLDEITIDGRE